MNFTDPNVRRPQASLEITPLIDVVFLLLVFFLLTTTFARPTPNQEPVPVRESVIDIQLARAGSGQSVGDVRRLSVYLDADGQLFMGTDEPMAPDELKERLHELMTTAEEQPVIDLKADRRTSHGAVIELLDLVKESGLENVNIVIEDIQ